MVIAISMSNRDWLINEYKRIGITKFPSDTDYDRLSEILAIAESDCALADLICKADLEIADELKLINEDSIRHSEEVRTKLARRLGIISME